MADKKKDKKAKKKDGGSKNAIIIAVAILLGFKLFGGGSSAAPAAPAQAAAAENQEMDCHAQDIKSPPKGGAVLELDAMNVNLAEGHYLRVTVGLELAEGVALETYKNENLGTKAADVVIGLTGGRSIAEFATKEDIDLLKEQLTEKIRPIYECKVVKVLFKEFVTQ